LGVLITPGTKLFPEIGSRPKPPEMTMPAICP
jgi:hypothetical protein